MTAFLYQRSSIIVSWPLVDTCGMPAVDLGRMAKVFISYSHDSAEHGERVLRFADALRLHGVDAELDRYHQRPPQGWPAWCEEQLRPEVSSHVLMICTRTYHDRAPRRGGGDLNKAGGLKPAAPQDRAALVPPAGLEPARPSRSSGF